MMDLELLALHELDRNGIIVYLKPNTPGVMTSKLIDEIRTLQDSIAKKYINQPFDTYYVIWYLQEDIGFSCCDLDFSYIHDCIKQNKEDNLERYIDRVFNLLFLNYIGLGLPVINCSILTKYLSGLSKEFFLMSKICFIYQRNYKCLNKIELYNEISKLSFKKELYDKNNYYFYNPIHVLQMKNIIENTPYEIPDNKAINLIKNEFDSLKEVALSRIYTLASKDIHILERFSKRSVR
ncbi:hypothetical protein [Legionella shakespearei]|uniref:Uncharacterized protein n=1 Tax=Legionella shakespearei DSM 23087 TaxID=1122169 RepID=A0A0W0YT60_9GAMM|nr:hypothetical protein [Legionella shakespearei]KTD60061.1 hypothetical protein Lsha_1811 [Legionella shakespearei DSM 23087]